MHPDEEEKYEASSKREESPTENQINQIKMLFKKIEKKLQPVMCEAMPSSETAKNGSSTTLGRMLDEVIYKGQDVLNRISL